jgi:proline dehydrogenase
MFGNVVLGVAGNGVVRATVTRTPLSRPVVSRFVAGEDVDAALAAVAALAGDGLRATLDHLGEDCTSPAQAAATVAAYRAVIPRLGAGAEISVKLSAVGQSLGADGPRLATDHARELAGFAYRHGVAVTLDMEDHRTADHTLATLRELRADFPDVGCVLQAMLHRTRDDVTELAVPGSRVRLVKGAYAEPAGVALQQKAEVDRAYVRYLRALVDSGAYPMIATHDPRIIAIAEHLLAGSPRPAEFQMLYGIRAPEQRRLAGAGHTVRVYVPFGTDWYGYFARRLAERPANLQFFLRSLFHH